MTGGVRIRRARSVAEVLAVAEPHEPRSTRLLHPVIHRGLGRGVRAVVAERPDGTPAGLAVIHRHTRDRWFASPLLLDPVAARPLARVVDRSPARYVEGTVDHVAPLAEHLRRRGRTIEQPFTAFRMPKRVLETLKLPIPTDDAGPATPADLDELVELYRDYELDWWTTAPRLRAGLREAVAGNRVIVVRREGRIAGAFRADGLTRRYTYWTGLTVHPDFRGQQLSVELGLRALLWTVSAGLGTCSTRAASSPLAPKNTFEDLGPEAELFEPVADRWLQIALRPRVRGVGRLHRGLERVEGRLRKRAPSTIDNARWIDEWERHDATWDERKAEWGVDELAAQHVEEDP